MTHHLTSLRQYVLRWLGREHGMATAEFVLLFPAALLIFLVAGESALINMRKTTLDRALEMTVRELRLGQIENPSPLELRNRICTRMGSPANCASDLRLELNVRSTSAASMAVPSLTDICVNRNSDVEPVVQFEPGAANDLVLVRACYVVDVYFKTSMGDLTVAEQMGEEHQLISTTAYVNEPR